MITAHVDLWSVKAAEAICITTNGTITGSGRGVMGRGVAMQACNKFARLKRILGNHLKANGNHVGVLLEQPMAHEDGSVLPHALVCYPVKHEWHQPANLYLIARSGWELVKLADAREWKRVVLPRPGCGNGHLTWDQVEPVISQILDDRFCVVNQ